VPSGFAVAEVQIFDAMGRALATEAKVAVQGAWTLDLSPFGEGMRYITVTSTDGWSTTRKVLVSGAK